MYLALVLVSVFCASLAQLSLKRGALGERCRGFWRQYANPWVIGGYAVLALALLANVFCLGHGVQVKEIATVEALGYLFVPVLSRVFFGEQLSRKKSLSISIIMTGVIVFFS